VQDAPPLGQALVRGDDRGLLFVPGGDDLVEDGAEIGIGRQVMPTRTRSARASSRPSSASFLTGIGFGRRWRRGSLSSFIEGWYNPRRRHSALEYLSPYDFRGAVHERRSQNRPRIDDRHGGRYLTIPLGARAVSLESGEPPAKRVNSIIEGDALAVAPKRLVFGDTLR
jgi:hypothetical protein